jgi:hypothetical protein
MDRNKAILDEIRHRGYVEVQNALMRTSDQDLALAMHYFHEDDITFVLSFLGSAKAEGIELQIHRLKHVKVTDEQVDGAMALLLSRLRGERGQRLSQKILPPRCPGPGPPQRLVMNMKKSFTPDEAPVYHGPLGCELRAAPAAADAGSKPSVYRAIFRLWAPGADGVALELADAADLADDYLNPPSLRTGAELSCDPRSGCWSAELELKSEPLNTVYRYRIHRDGRRHILADPYARAFAPFPGAAVEAALGELHAWSVPVPPDADLEPAGGWEGLQRPTGNGAAGSGAPGNIVIYEAMVRDMSVHPDSGVAPALRGTYLGMAEKLDYIASLGVTHIQLLPVMKAYSADETQRDFEAGTGGGNNYNWGYDPLSYFVPEGWFSTDPFDPLSRIRELKTLIREAHARGLGIILDVVYNHMARTHTLEASCPGYWFRRDDAGGVHLEFRMRQRFRQPEAHGPAADPRQPALFSGGIQRRRLPFRPDGIDRRQNDPRSRRNAEGYPTGCGHARRGLANVQRTLRYRRHGSGPGR